MSDQAIAERVELDKKDKGELQAIVAALGGKANSRMKKSDLIDSILLLSGVTPAASGGQSEADSSRVTHGESGGGSDRESAGGAGASDSKPVDSVGGSETQAGVADAVQAGDTDSRDDAAGSSVGGSAERNSGRRPAVAAAGAASGSDSRSSAPTGGTSGSTRGSDDDVAADDGGSSRRRRGKRRPDEPPAEWETELQGSGQGGGQSGSQPRGGTNANRDQSSGQSKGGQRDGGQRDGGQRDGGQRDGGQRDGGQRDGGQRDGGQRDGGQRDGGQRDGGQQQGRGRQQGGQSQGGRQNRQSADPGNQQPNDQQSASELNDDVDANGDDTESGNRRRRRRGRGRDRDDNIEAVSQEPIAVSGYLDLRDDGYGFLRVAGLLPTKDDVYVPVKMARQFDLRRGDLVTGLARPANRNEKNPALQQLDTINGSDPEAIRNRPEFEKLTPLFPDERIRLERSRQPVDLTARIIDLIAPIGKGQRGLIVSPPKAGKTTIVKELITSIEENHPEIELIVLLLDERPEEVTDMRRHLERGEVVASTFDRPTEEHCAIAELTIERAKRMVEQGKDVVVVLDGITRLARAYNMAATGTGRIMSGGVDAGALYPPKRFLGAARNLEEGGSLTILATALVETGSRMDEVIFEEFKGTGNMELRLDRGLAERYVFPAIDALGSSTRRSELLMDGKEHVLSLKLRKVLAGMAGGEDGSAASAMNLLMDRLKTFKTNEEFLTEIARSS